MSVKCGIVGLPNVGKSTLFNCLTKAGIPAQNYPFCTIEPNVGIVPVPDERLAQIATIIQPERLVPAMVEFVDIAGLVKGAAAGEGLGNKFLSHIRETDAILHVVRCFEDDNITHVVNTIDPARDIAIIQTELALADLETVTRALERVQTRLKTPDKQAPLQRDCLLRLQTALNIGQAIRSLHFTSEEICFVKSLQLLTMKPVLYVANIAETPVENNPLLDAVYRIAQQESSAVIALSAQMEAEIAELNEVDKALFLTEWHLTEPGLNRLIRASYALLNLETYFTAGKKEVRAWTISKQTTAPKAASVIHTDFEKGFICVEVIAYHDFIQHHGESGAKEAGKWRLEGKEYIVQDGDIMHFRFNVTSTQQK